MIKGPYKLPKGWRWVRLGEVARIFSGSPAPQEKRYFEEGSTPFVRVQDLGRYGITTNLTETADKVNEEAVKELRLVKANKGTILFPKSGAAILTNSRAILGEDAYIVSHLAAVEPFHDILETLWAFYWLCTVDMRQYIDNPAYPSLRLSKIRELLIPLPPLDEQKRIVARVEELMSRIKEAKKLREETKKQTELLWQSVLAETFPQPGTQLPNGWRWVRLGEVCTYERQTIDPRRYPHQEFLLFSIPAYDNNKQPELRKGSEIGSSKLKIKPNICLFSKLNPRIPRAWVIKSDESIPDLPMLASTEFLALRPHTHLIDLDYLGLCLLSKVFLSQFQVGVTGATSSRQRLKQEDVLNALIPLPTLEEQKRIANYLQEVHEKIQELKEVQAKTEEEIKLLEQSILEKAFRGEL